MHGTYRNICHLTLVNINHTQIKISFGDIPNSNSIDILMPYAIFDNIPVIKQSHGCSCQGCKATNHTGTLRNLLNPASGTYANTRRNSSEPSGTFRTLPLEPTPTRAGSLRNLPSYNSTHRNSPAHTGTLRNPPPEPASGTRVRNLHQRTPELSGTFGNPRPEPTPAHARTLRNLPEPAPGTYTSTRQNSPELSGTRLRNLHQHTPELSGTFRNPPPEFTPAHTGTLRNLPEPSSGTCSCDPHRHTPELIWAEDPISLRCWGKYMYIYATDDVL